MADECGTIGQLLGDHPGRLLVDAARNNGRSGLTSASRPVHRAQERAQG